MDIQIKVSLSESEIEFLQEFKSIGLKIYYSQYYAGFRTKWAAEIKSFQTNGLLYHSNSFATGRAICYELTDLGKEVLHAYALEIS